MIQRIQSVYLLVAAALTFCLFGVPYVGFDFHPCFGDNSTYVNMTVCHMSPSFSLAKKMLPLAITTLCAAVLCLIAIFLYRDRTRQMKVVKLCIAIQAIVLIAMVAYCYGLNRSIVGFSAEINPKIAAVFPIVNIVLLILAYRGIKADDDLVKSADRLR